MLYERVPGMMYHAACKVEFQPSKRSYSQLTFSTFYKITTQHVMERSTSAPDERVLRTTQLARLSFNHPSVVLTTDVVQYFLLQSKSKHVILRQPPQIRTRRPQRLPRGSVSRINAHESSCIFPLAFHAIMKAAEFSAVSHHPSLFVRRGGGGTSASTASRITLVKDSAISEIPLGCKGRSGSLEMIRATTRCLQSPSNRNFCRSKGWICFFCTYASVGRNTTAEADHRVYDVIV